MKETIMLHKAILLFTLISLSFTGFAQKNVLNALWRDSNIVIDGDPKDWDQPFRYYDSKAKIQYSVVNDGKDLYIALKTMDEHAEMKIMRAGMDVSINTSGKKKETSTIHYPLPGENKLEWIANPAEPDQQRLDIPDIKRMRLDYPLSVKQMQLTGFKDIPAAVMPIENRYGIQLAIGWDRDHVFTYELKVPFATFYKDAITAADVSTPINITVKVYGFNVPQQISIATASDPTMANTGLRDQSYGDQRNGSSSQNNTQHMMPMAKVNPMSESLQVQMRMKLALRQ